jgi:hypothetical protein
MTTGYKDYVNCKLCRKAIAAREALESCKAKQQKAKERVMTTDEALAVADELDGDIRSTTALKQLAQDVRELRAKNEEYKRLYDLRGQALQRPCVQCGHVPLTIRAANERKDGA